MSVSFTPSITWSPVSPRRANSPALKKASCMRGSKNEVAPPVGSDDWSASRISRASFRCASLAGRALAKGGSDPFCERHGNSTAQIDLPRKRLRTVQPIALCSPGDPLTASLAMTRASASISFGLSAMPEPPVGRGAGGTIGAAGSVAATSCRLFQIHASSPAPIPPPSSAYGRMRLTDLSPVVRGRLRTGVDVFGVPCIGGSRLGPLRGVGRSTLATENATLLLYTGRVAAILELIDGARPWMQSSVMHHPRTDWPRSGRHGVSLFPTWQVPPRHDRRDTRRRRE